MWWDLQLESSSGYQCGEGDRRSNKLGHPDWGRGELVGGTGQEPGGESEGHSPTPSVWGGSRSTPATPSRAPRLTGKASPRLPAPLRGAGGWLWRREVPGKGCKWPLEEPASRGGGETHSHFSLEI